MNEENLKPFVKGEQRQKDLGKLGGIASGEARRVRKTLKEELLILLEQGDTQEKISLSMIQEALKGNTKAFEIIRDTIGEKPKEEIEVSDVTNKKFDEICSQIGGDGLNE